MGIGCCLQSFGLPSLERLYRYLSGASSFRLQVSLAQRSGRRRWLNLQDNENVCDQALRRHKILCTEINVEIKESHPYSQAITHGALDDLFGIHGAQLTEAICWTRGVTGPTPLGVINKDTDLDHIGYPLERQSALRFAMEASSPKKKKTNAGEAVAGLIEALQQPRNPLLIQSTGYLSTKQIPSETGLRMTLKSGRIDLDRAPADTGPSNF
jgi:hypothetical protein